jgi:hypothetical protein
MRSFATYTIAAVAGGTMLASLSPASAFTLSGPSLEQPVASAQIDKVWWRYGYGYRGYGWRGYGYGYRPGWGYGHCWRGYSGALHCN